MQRDKAEELWDAHRRMTRVAVPQYREAVFGEHFVSEREAVTLPSAKGDVEHLQMRVTEDWLARRFG